MRNRTGVVIFFLCMLLSSFAMSYDRGELVDAKYSTRTPQKTIVSLLAFLQDDRFDPAIASATIAGDYTKGEKIGYALKIKQIIDKKEAEVDLSEIPDKRLYKDKTSKERIYILFEDFPDLYLERINSNWLFSEHSIDNLPEIHKQLFPIVAPVPEFDFEELWEEVDSLGKDSVVTKVKKKTVVKRAPVVKTEKEMSDFYDKFDLSSPYETVRSHLIFLQDFNYKPELAAKTLNAPSRDENEKIALAIKLKQIYDGRGKYIDLASISRDPNFADSLGRMRKYIVEPSIPEIYLEKKGDDWVYSEASVEKIGSLYERTYPIVGASATFKYREILQKYFPEKSGMIFGQPIWKFMGLILLLVGIFITNALLVFLSRQVISLFNKDEAYQKVVIAIISQFYLILAVYFSNIVLQIINFTIEVYRYIIEVRDVLLVVLITVFLFKIIDLLAFHTLQGEDDSKRFFKARKSVMPFFSMTGKILITLVSVSYTLQMLGVDVSTLLAGISIGGLALALAAQDTLKNFFGSIMILMDSPFRVGDFISADKDGIKGSVEKIGLRSTLIRTVNDSVISVPNSSLANSQVDNLGRRNYRRLKFYLPLEFGQEMTNIHDLKRGIESVIIDHPKLRDDRYYCNLYDLTPYSVRMIVIAYVKGSYAEEMETRHEVLSQILLKASEMNVKVATLPKGFVPDEPAKATAGGGGLGSNDSGSLVF
ncbi:mechanosensitive ion channel family protein [Aureibacter tunicatorum]|uniref:MscS family membrane protein n=1 Tax=Aureibacter tunicatorum TaxID=866807 RepID=A0AAE4BS31_9BACT|nr:mechanosensitive ion channel family protein [Aureibacter tunicatorum]MDR6237927.1 MscS family membrane protein [Aureibacter tunicatorum]BDD02960.1 hypothetical protein AUTU_04430 [Aureibacter tunicatorum]